MKTTRISPERQNKNNYCNYVQIYIYLGERNFNPVVIF